MLMLFACVRDTGEPLSSTRAAMATTPIKFAVLAVAVVAAVALNSSSTTDAVTCRCPLCPAGRAASSW